MADETRCCTRCNNQLPISEFHITIKRGKPYLYPHCKPCQRAYVKNHYENNRQAYVDKARKRGKEVISCTRKRLAAYLETHPCIDCGEKDLVVLHFDHVRGEKRAHVSRLVTCGFPWETVEAEIQKCEVRCANCHTRKTAASFGWWNSSS